MQPDTTAVSTTKDYLNTPLVEIIQKVQILPSEGIYVAVSVGVLLFIVGWFGGTRFNRKQITYSVIIVMLVGIFSMPLPALLLRWLLTFISPMPALLIVYILWTGLMLGMVLSLYETWIVTIKEQFGTGR